MSGGIAYVLDEDGGFRARCNTELVGFDEITPDEAVELRGCVAEHRRAHRLAGGRAGAGRLGQRARALREGDAARLQARPQLSMAEEEERTAARRQPRGPRSRPDGRARRLPAPRAGGLRQARPRGARATTTGSTSRCPTTSVLREQGGRCMDCGVPFCHEGCPLGNLIPDWNDLVYRDHWREALDQLHATNNFPEFTGLICPAPCESACVLDINDDPVTIEQIELAIVTRGFEEGWITARPAGGAHRQDGRRWSAPARPDWPWPPSSTSSGHSVTVYERDEGPGGLLRFGVPDAKLEKWIIDRRVRLLEEEGIEFECGVDVGGGRDRRASCAAAPRRAGDGHRLARAPRPGGARPRARRRALRDGVPLPAQPGRGRDGGPQRAADAARARDHAPRASAWWSWAAATPAWTASPTPCARARRTC